MIWAKWGGGGGGGGDGMSGVEHSPLAGFPLYYIVNST